MMYLPGPLAGKGDEGLLFQPVLSAGPREEGTLRMIDARRSES